MLQLCWVHLLVLIKKNKVHSHKFEDLIIFIQWFINQAASHLATRKALHGVYKVEGFYREKGGAREELQKEKMDDF